MSDEAKPTPSADQTASSEPKLAEDETKLATNPVGDESKEAPNAGPTYTESATNVATSAATSASAAAAGVKDSVFSMFGGGGKKEVKKDEDEGKDEPSGSSKAQKDAEDEEVRLNPSGSEERITDQFTRRRQTMKRLMYTSSLS